MLELGTRAPDFDLPDATGRRVARAAYAGKPLLVMFICNHCPYVIHVAPELARLTDEAMEKGVGVVGINSNDFGAYPDDSPAKMLEESKRRGYRFPYLVDESQAVARAYQAACTPDFFLFDAGGSLVYRGQMDGARPGNGVAVTGEDLRAALDAVLAGRTPAAEQRPSLGCNIKWRS
jgi:peroxiredoxin